MCVHQRMAFVYTANTAMRVPAESAGLQSEQDVLSQQFGGKPEIDAKATLDVFRKAVKEIAKGEIERQNAATKIISKK